MTELDALYATALQLEKDLGDYIERHPNLRANDAADLADKLALEVGRIWSGGLR